MEKFAGDRDSAQTPVLDVRPGRVLPKPPETDKTGTGIGLRGTLDSSKWDREGRQVGVGRWGFLGQVRHFRRQDDKVYGSSCPGSRSSAPAGKANLPS